MDFAIYKSVTQQFLQVKRWMPLRCTNDAKRTVFHSIQEVSIELLGSLFQPSSDNLHLLNPNQDETRVLLCQCWTKQHHTFCISFTVITIELTVVLLKLNRGQIMLPSSKSTTQRFPQTQLLTPFRYSERCSRISMA